MNKDINTAIRLLNEMEYNEGIDLLENILSDDPKNEIALYNLALAYNSVNHPESAIKTFNYYLKNYPKTGSVLAGLGYSLYLNKEIEKAKNILEEAILLEPKNIYALRNLGGILAELGEYERAKTIFNETLLIDPKDHKSLVGLGIIFFRNEDYIKSENYFYQVIALPLSEDEKDIAKTYLTKIAEKIFKNKNFRVDAIMYLISAINTYNKMDLDDIQKLVFEISTVGQKGFDLNNPDKKYKIYSLTDKEVSGLYAVCHMYAGFQIIDPSIDIGFDLSNEYAHAKKIVETGLM